MTPSHLNASSSKEVKGNLFGRQAGESAENDVCGMRKMVFSLLQ